MRAPTAITALAAANVAMLLSACNPGPIEGVLIGTWEITFPLGMDSTTFVTFYADHTMVSFGDSMLGPNEIYFHGRWSADEEQITIRPDAREEHDEPWELRIVKKGSNKLHLHSSGRDYNDIWTRRSIAPPQASPEPKPLEVLLEPTS